MIAFLVQIDAWAGSVATPVRIASHDDDRLCHLDGVVWVPALARTPVLRHDFFDGAFDGQIDAPTGEISVAIGAVPGFAALSLHDARVRVWSGVLGDGWGGFTLIFDGRVQEQPAVEDAVAQISVGVDDAWLDEPLLPTFAGSGGAEGGADLRGQVRPLALGAPRFCEGVLVDPVNLIWQVSGCGLIGGISMVYDRLSRFGASSGDYPDWAALVAATVPAGGWATCYAAGLVRMGAPADGVLTFDVSGDRAGAIGWARRAGSIIWRIADIAGASARVAAGDFEALDTARPWNLSLYLTEQVTARELIVSVAQSVNATVFVDWLGQLRVLPVQINASLATLAADGSAVPAVVRTRAMPVAAPWWRLAQEADVTQRVHSDEEIAFLDRATVDDVSAVQVLAEAAQATADAKRTTFFQPDPPSAAQSEENDYWIDTSDGRGYRRVAGSGRLAVGANAVTLGGAGLLLCWTPIEDARIVAAITLAGDAAAIADRKVESFSMARATDPEPVGSGVGDYLFREYLSPVQVDRWTGAGWVPMATHGATAGQVGDIASAATTADWAGVTGAGKPEDGATVGAPVGTNVGSTPVEDVEVAAQISVAAANVDGTIKENNVTSVSISPKVIGQYGTVSFAPSIIQPSASPTIYFNSATISVEQTSPELTFGDIEFHYNFEFTSDDTGMGVVAVIQRIHSGVTTNIVTMNFTPKWNHAVSSGIYGANVNKKINLGGTGPEGVSQYRLRLSIYGGGSPYPNQVDVSDGFFSLKTLPV